MANEEVNSGRRRFLTATTAVVGAVGVAGAAVPFISSWKPSARAKVAGAPLEVDISGLAQEPGMLMIVQWRGKPVWIYQRTPEQLAALPTLGEMVRSLGAAAPERRSGPVLFKSCGWAGWDLAAARLALRRASPAPAATAHLADPSA